MIKHLSKEEIQKQRRSINPIWLDDMVDTINKLIDEIDYLKQNKL